MISLFVCIPQNIKLFMTWGDIDKTAKILSLTDISTTLVTFKMIHLWDAKKKLKPLIFHIRQDWTNSKPENERKLMTHFARKCRNVSLLYVFLSQSTFVFYTAQQIFVAIMEGKTNLTNVTRETYVVSYFPYDLNKSPNFQLSWLMQCISIAFGNIAFATIDSFFAILVLHICGQLRVLRQRVLKCVEEPSGEFRKWKLQNKVSLIVRRHDYLNNCIDIVEDTFNMIFLVQLSGFIVTFCVQGYILILPLVALISEDWRNSKTEKERIIMLNMARTARKISLICVFLSQGTVIFHTAGEMYFTITDRFNEYANQTRRTYIISHFPYDTKNSPNFELTWFSQFLATILATITYAGVHGFFAVLVMHLCAQFAILRYRLIDAIHKIVTKTEKKEFRDEYAAIIRRHQLLNRCVEIIEDAFNMLFLAEILTCSIQFCLQGYQLSIMTGNHEEPLPIVLLIVMVTFLMYMLVLFYIYCYVAEELRYQSTEIVFAAYSCEWYELPSKEANNLLLLMQRAKTPSTLTAGKFCNLSLQLFNKILKTSAGYLSVLLTMTNKEDI
ncbi:odorant receptor 22c-like [Belonocnema kinseyi]|uniref:odorant receptor 22c-like n=1 Tax=Belonocnema kinseyi TaxID=2817044 RepID=UPI00143E08CF|nr:odorant receptor 22c-like [Belonocnema kinseyi]